MKTQGELLKTEAEEMESSGDKNGISVDAKGIRWDLADRIKDDCSDAVLLEWMIPIPPKAAIETAMDASVTVSIGEATHGIERFMLRESFVFS